MVNSKWIVAFFDLGRPGHRLLSRLLARRGYRHCLAFTFVSESSIWIVIGADKRIRAIDGNELDDILGMLAGKVRFLTYHGPIQKQPFVQLWTCTGIVKAAMGFSAPLAVSPYGLYCALKRAGASPDFISEKLT